MHSPFHHRRDRAITTEDGRGAEAPAREGVSREHGYQTRGGSVRQRERQDDRSSSKPTSGRRTGSARKDKGRRCQAEGRSGLKNQEGRTPATAVIAGDIQGGEVGLQILRQR